MFFVGSYLIELPLIIEFFRMALGRLTSLGLSKIVPVYAYCPEVLINCTLVYSQRGPSVNGSQPSRLLSATEYLEMFA